MNQDSRRLRCYQNWLALDGLPQPADGWVQAIRNAGYDGIQFIEPLDLALVAEARKVNLGVCGSGRVNTPNDAYRLAQEARSAGLECLTLHVGWGYEDDAQANNLIEAVLDASARHEMPMYAETHRATIFQDMWRTVQFVRKYPDLTFNGDFSHWYTGSEMVYGDFEEKAAFIQPVIDRVHFLHGRIGNPGCMQVDVGEIDHARDLPFVGHFRILWTRVFAAFLRRSSPDETLIFASELLAANVYYARTFGGKEESDRWSQSLVLMDLAREWFGEAEQDFHSTINR
jgi:sugar phosphate isomerase/epimerase